MRYALLAGFLLLGPFQALRASPTGNAWWVDASFPATGTSYEGIDISQLDPAWSKFSILTWNALPPEAKEDLPMMRKEGFKFQLDQVSGPKGVRNRALCGVFERKNGERGNFLLILERMGQGPWKVAFLHQGTITQNFSVLVRRRQGVFWAVCMLCDEYYKIVYRKGEYDLEINPAGAD